jgi:hypothetical protein
MFTDLVERVIGVLSDCPLGRAAEGMALDKPMSEYDGSIDRSMDVRDFGIDEGFASAKSIFTSEVYSNWEGMDAKQRESIAIDYAKAVGDGMNIEIKGVIFKPMKVNEDGYNNGDGNIYLNERYLTSHGEGEDQLYGLINTIAHEARHQFQSEAIKNPEKHGLDRDLAADWKNAGINYPSRVLMMLNPRAYYDNLLERDAYYFGDTIEGQFRSVMANA